jgi:UDP:flavonoid glycosyltransferase YjiC (YdhE family)
VVLVTQGTVSNHDFGQLVIPTLAALADDPDLLVVVSASGRSIDAIRGPVPSNARLASYMPLEWLLPKVDALVTNGGYGTVNQALSAQLRDSDRRRGTDRGQGGCERPHRLVWGRHRPQDR